MHASLDKTLTTEELQALSFMHFYVATENYPDREEACRVKWQCDYQKRTATAVVGGGVIMQSPMLFLRLLRISIRGWENLDVFRERSTIGWTAETQQPVNPPHVFHHLTYRPGLLQLEGVGTRPAALYKWLFKGAFVEAACRLEPNQEFCRREYAANLERRRRILQNNPLEARLRIPLDAEDAAFLRSVVGPEDTTD